MQNDDDDDDDKWHFKSNKSIGFQVANSRDHTDLCLSQTEVEIMWIASGESGKRGPTVSRCALDDLDEFGGFWTSAE